MQLLVIIIATMMVLVNSSPIFKHYDQPDYKLEKKQPKDGSFEVRRYAAANWTSTSMQGSEISDEAREFIKLFKYISGSNVQKVKMAMTIPVTIRFESPPCIMCNRTYTMSFYVAKDFQYSPPTPTDKKVVVENRPEFVAYVRTFPGFACEKTYRKNAMALHEDLLRNGIIDSMVMKNIFYGATYDSPMHIFKRHNEVWVIGAKKSPHDLLSFYPTE